MMNHDKSPVAWQQWLLMLALVATVFVVYQPVWQGGLLWDDDGHVTRPELRSWDGLRRIWFEVAATQQYYPLLHSFFWLQHRLWGDATLGYHLVNIALHAAAAVLVARVLRRLGIPGAYLAAAVFALHPVQVESVAWISEQKNTLSAVFYLAAALMYLRFAGTVPFLAARGLSPFSPPNTATLPTDVVGEKGDCPPMPPRSARLGPARGTAGETPALHGRVARPARARPAPRSIPVMRHALSGRATPRTAYALALALFVLGLLSKTVTATLPAALLVVLWWQRGRLSWKRDVLPLLPFFLLGAAAGVLTAWVEYHLIGAEGAEFDFTLVERFLIAGRVVWFYLGKLFWPAELIFIYPRWNVSQQVWWQYLFPLAAMLLLFLLWAIRARTRGPLAALLFFGGTLFPVLGFFNVYPFRYSLVADHFQYLASLGIITLASAGAALLLAHWSLWAKPMGHACCAVLLLALASLSLQQSTMYTDIDALTAMTIERNPTGPMAYNLRGFVLAEWGRTDEAIACYQQAVQLQPEIDSHINLGILLSRVGRTEEAIEQFKRALHMKPGHAEAHNHLGIALDNLGRTDEAIVHYQRALQLSPGQARFHNNLANALVKLGKQQEAIEQYGEALRLQPDYPLAHCNLAIALSAVGRTHEAIAHYHEALRLEPDLAGARNNLALCLVRVGKTSEAIALYNEALRHKGDDDAAHYNLGNLLSAAGRPDEAFAHYRQVLRLRPSGDLGRFALTGAIGAAGKSRNALESYRQILEFVPNSTEALNRLAWLLATREAADGGDADQALQLAERAHTLATEQSAGSLDTLAAAYAAAGRFSDAVVAAQQAVQLAESTGQTALAKNIQARLDLYRAGRPYREVPRLPQ